MCQNQGFRTARDSLNPFPFNLGHVGIEIALKRGWWKGEGNK
jgi:hypothetical protein